MTVKKLPIKGTARALALEKISKNELQDYYAYHTRKDVCDYFNITQNTLHWLLNFYDIKKTTEQKRETLEIKYDGLDNFYDARNAASNETKINKYGSLEAFEHFRIEKQLEGILQKYETMENYIEHMTESYKQTCMERYGVENVSQLDSVKQKKKETLESNFGSLENAYNKRQKKSNETWITKYGSLDNYRKYQQELSKQTCMEKYGVENPFASLEIQEQIKNTCIEKYGVEYTCMLDSCRSNGNNNSKPNLNFMKLLEDNNIKIDTREFPLGKYIYDFKVGQLLFEINPAATHNSTWSPFGDHTGISKDYHQLKSKNAFQAGYRCIHIFDWTNKDDVIYNIKNEKYEIYEQTFQEPRLYMYNIKKEILENTMCDDCVEIYDDGIVVNNGGV